MLQVMTNKVEMDEPILGKYQRLLMMVDNDGYGRMMMMVWMDDDDGSEKIPCLWQVMFFLVEKVL